MDVFLVKLQVQATKKGLHKKCFKWILGNLLDERFSEWHIDGWLSSVFEQIQ